ncbi:hypothetical protein QBC42DRAFT_56207 [Cladorrhinum samala]|uniref:Fungal N-terminal domain-containing protein n=1 Tax=Cladorrhinum samala TaxID=585594 RepID=A0AAV9H960_9PEZI|nr:hypothetical protein QBC42DRAFT_56207 [Cladorrhinum samala]
MSDPLSTAGSVVGIISLGIQVCNGLVSYLRSARGRKKDVTDALHEAETLIPILYSLHELLPRLPPEISVTSIQKCLKDSEEQLLAMQEWLIDLRGSSDTTTLKGKVEEAGRSAVYPFRQGKLDELRKTLRQLLDGLQMSVDVAAVSLAVESGNRLSKVETAVETLEGVSPRLVDGIQELRDKLDSLQQRFSDTCRLIEERFDRLDWNVTLVHADTRTIASNTALVASRTDQTAEEVKRLREGFEEFKQQILRGPPPQSQSTEFDSFTPRTGHLVTRRRDMSSSKTNCTCPAVNRNMSSTYVRLGGLVFQYNQEVKQKHLLGCKCYGIPQKKNRRLKAEMSLPMAWLLRRAFTASVDFVTGSGGVGVSIGLKNFVPGHLDPVRSFLDENIWQLRNSSSPKAIIQLFETMERGILSLYQERRASPLNRDEKGTGHAESLLSEVMNSRVYRHAIVSHESVTHAMLRLLETLVDLGASGDAPNGGWDTEYNVSGLKKIGGEKVSVIGFQNLRRIASYTSSIFVEIPRESLLGKWSIHDQDELRHIFSIFIDSRLDIHPIFRAICSRSETDLITCISRDPDSPMETISGFTTLHLCAQWPQGLKCLLETRAKTTLDSCSYRSRSTVVEMAISLNCHQAIDILMAADCSFSMDTDVGGRRLCLASAECTPVIASHIAARRRRLLELARGRREPFSAVDPVDVPDTEAAKLCEAIRKSGICIPPHLSVDKYYASVYHCSSLQLEQFPIFFDNGFRNLCAHNHQGLTTAMILCASDVSLISTPQLSWLEEKGAFEQTPEDPLNLGLNKASTGWHYLAAMGGWRTILRRSLVGDMHYETLALHELNRRPHLARDRCICWCNVSEQGCSPSKIFWKVQLDELLEPRLLRRIKRTRTHFFWHSLFHYRLDTGSKSRLEPRAATLDLVRILTFEALEMRHTCCYLKRVKPDTEALKSCSGPPLEEQKHEGADHFEQNDSDDDDDDDDGDHDYQPLFYDDYFYDEFEHVIASCKQSRLHRIRSSEQEQQKARELDKLMEEFAKQLQQIAPSPTAFEGFIRGYWRRRIRDLYKEDCNEVEAMKRSANQVRTYVLPERLDSFFRGTLQLLDEDEHENGNCSEHGEEDPDSETYYYDPYYQSRERLCRFGGRCIYCEEELNT